MLTKAMNFIATTLKVAGLVLVFAVALASLGWLQRFDPWPSVSGAVAAAIGGAVAWRAKGATTRTASVLLIFFSLICLIRAGVWLQEYSTENQLAEAAEQNKAKEAARAQAAIEAEARAKAEREELAQLRKSDVEKYLARLKGIDMSKWLDEAKLLSPKTYAAHQEEMRRQSEQSELARQRKWPKDYLTLDFTWTAGGFGAVMVANFTIKSTLQFPVRDIAVRCTGSGNSGTELGVVRQTLYEIIPPKSTKRINNINMGFIPGQMTRANCEIMSVKAD